LFRCRQILVAIALLGTAASRLLQAQHPAVDTGSIGGAAYRIDFTADWNHGLVMYAHGYMIADDRPDTLRRTEFANAFISRGFAFAQSAYRKKGLAIQEGIEDTEALRAYFVRRYGRPRETYIVGHSMGGAITVALSELHGNEYDGALPLCGAIAPLTGTIGRRVFDMVVTFDYLFPGALGPAPGNQLAGRGDTISVDARRAAIAAALASAPDRAEMFATRFGITGAGAARRLADVVAFYAAIADEAVRHAGGNPYDNTNTIYTGFPDDSALNRGVRRMAADSTALAYIVRFYSPTGRISKPMLAVHTTGDPIVPATVESDYESLTEIAGTDRLFVVDYVVAPGHCQISPAQVGTAFDALRSWSHHGARPVPGELETAH
jgi:pimeloyl-ACP methyl ester carboxylesterase